MKQTAIEWLENKCSEFETIYDSLPSRLYEYIQQAKEMEKQQIIQSNRDGVDMIVNEKHFITGEQYYNETFKNQLQG